MTTEKKAKAYDEALDRAKDCLTNKKFKDLDDTPESVTTYIFPELRENEDEIHRKWILEYLYDGLRKSDEQFKDQFKSAIAWLEKQKEPRDYRNLYKGVSESDWFKQNYVGKSLGEEQKPAELTPLATLLSNYLKNDFEYFAGKKWDETRWNETLNIQASELLRYAKKELEKEQKPEWSKEDEEIFNNIIEKAKGGYWIEVNEITWLITRFKSIRPQLRHRDTYYDIIHNILDSLKGIDFTQITPEHRVSLLNDIRVKCKNADECAAILDEPSWKPSEYHLSALLAVLNDPDNIGSQTCQLALTDLYEQLKKLM